MVLYQGPQTGKLRPQAGPGAGILKGPFGQFVIIGDGLFIVLRAGEGGVPAVEQDDRVCGKAFAGGILASQLFPELQKKVFVVVSH